MANRMPSMLALLGLLAVAGYQNRDKISEALKGVQNRSGAPGDKPPQDGLGGILDGLGGLLGGAAGGTGLAGGLGDLMDSFKQSGQKEVADSWITPGVPTQGLTPDQVEKAIGAENLDELSRRTGLTRDELLTRLSKAIPENVDRLTPEGKFPTEDEARGYFSGTA
ncbi:MAG: DUF937 domain-containing protein [Hyphomicrobiales bacterium]|nr:MAG: DUF937 domain-containing protein [Hyphomicrobiales bacterium]